MYKAKAYSAATPPRSWRRDTIDRRKATETDVQIEILFCGICHSDLHTARNEWAEFMPTTYPVVCRATRSSARSLRSDQRSRSTSWATLSASDAWWTRDHACPACQANMEQFCPNGVFTYNSPDKHLGGVTYGGYSDSIVCRRELRPERAREPRPGQLSRRSCAPGSRPTRRCATGRSGRARRSVSWGSAVWGIWA